MHQLFKASLHTREILAELGPILDSGWVGLGPKTAEFEKKLGESVSPDCRFLAMNSCTAALHIALRILGLPKGAKVLTTPVTFVSTNHAILYEGLEPVFCDVEPLTGNLSADAAEKALARHDISAIMVVHLGGYACDMDRIDEMARARGIPVVEDCAHAFGGRYRDGRRIGDTANLCAWSFQAVKNLPIGDGGALSTTDPGLVERVRRLRWLGIDQDTISRFRPANALSASSAPSDKVYQYKWDYNVTEAGFKYHLNDIHACIGLVQLRHIEADNRRRAAIAALYRARLGGLDGVRLPDYAREDVSSHHFLPLFFEDKAAVYRALTEREIYPGMHYKRNDRYPMYQACAKVGSGKAGNDLDGAHWYESRELTLPIHLGLSDADVHYICDVASEALGRGRPDWGKGGALPIPTASIPSTAAAAPIAAPEDPGPARRA